MSRSSYTGFLNHLNMYLNPCIILYHTKAAVYVHYSFPVTYLDTHAFIWRQTEWQSRFNLRRLAVCRHKIQPRCPSPVCFFVSLSLFSCPLFLCERGLGSWNVCCVMALTAYDTNAVCSDLSLSAKWLFPVVILRWNLTHLVWKQGCQWDAQTHSTCLYCFQSFYFVNTRKSCPFQTLQLFRSIIHDAHIGKTWTLQQWTWAEKDCVLQRIKHSNQQLVDSCILVHNEVTHCINKREFECKQVWVGPLGPNLPVNVNVHLCMKRASGLPW